jgi:hypothetical protein
MWSKEGTVMRTPIATRLRIVVPIALLSLVAFTACDRTSDTDEQVAELEQQVADLEAELEQTQGQLEDSEAANDGLEEQLTQTRADLSSTQDELASTQAQLLDAQAQLAQVGELVLEDGTYIGQVLGAKTNPYRVILFDAAGLFRAAQVSQDVTITSGGSDYSLSEFGRLLASTDPDDAKLANGNYQVIVKDGLVTSIKKSKK